jgi:hypothetical protein
MVAAKGVVPVVVVVERVVGGDVVAVNKKKS